MKRVRVIPVLLLARNGMVKTKHFSNPKYLGDPINAVKIFNEKGADELILLDIEATAKGRVEIDWVEDIVSEAFMPIAYGGGINSMEHCLELFKRGVEKIVINTALPRHPELVSQIAGHFGSQAVVAAIDVRRNFWRKAHAYVRNGSKDTGLTPVDLARLAEKSGAGEIMVTSIEREGTFGGYDIELSRAVADSVGVPVIGHGGAGRIQDFKDAVLHGGCSAVAAGSMFVFAAKDQGMLISYPSEKELEDHFWTQLT